MLISLQIAVDDDLMDSSLELGAGTKINSRFFVLIIHVHAIYQVPRLDLFSEDDHLHGRMILHMGLNHRKFAIWASAIVSIDSLHTKRYISDDNNIGRR